MQQDGTEPAPALVVIDVQKGIDDPGWGRRNNPRAEANIARLLDAWRAASRPIFHIRHNSTEPESAYRPGQPGNDFKPEARPLPGETVVEKTTNSAFIGTDLERRLRDGNIDTLVMTGVITNNSVEATVRMAGNLGFNACLVSDATATVDKRDLDGRLWPAEDVHALSLANMHGEYATVISTDEALISFGAAFARPLAGK
jgi:nicotinamidase-related amidase